MSRKWKDMRAKVDEEDGVCRYCGGPYAQAAHIIPRSLIPKRGHSDLNGEDPRNCVPLCEARGCHSGYDNHNIDILPLLTKEEQAYAVELVGLAAAFRQVTGQRV
jgi:5-methylcytosine-specific restriction endonuclease McrA